jgi:hypothetical protein
MQRYQQNYFSLILVFKNAKSCHVFYFLLLMFFHFFRPGHIKFKIKLYLFIY